MEDQPPPAMALGRRIHNVAWGEVSKPGRATWVRPKATGFGGSQLMMNMPYKGKAVGCMKPFSYWRRMRTALIGVMVDR